MRIEPIGSYSYQPFIYNTNQLNRNSLSRVKPIEKDLLSSRTDFTGLVEDKPEPPKQNENPLRPGETINFSDMLERQMSEGRRNAARIMKPAEAAASEKNSQSNAARQTDEIPYPMKRALEAYTANMMIA